MKINKLRVRNFMNFEEQTFDFKSNFTVVIGENGLGKSAVLNAMRVACGTYILGLDVKTWNIRKSDVHIKNFGDSQEEQTPVEVEVLEWEWNGKKQASTFRRELNSLVGRTSSSSAHVMAAKNYGISVQAEIKKLGIKNVDLPVIAYFGTGRLHKAGQVRNSSKGQTGRKIITFGYENWYDMKATSYKYSSWLKAIDEDTSKDLIDAFRNAIIDAVPNIKKDFKIRGNEMFFRQDSINQNYIYSPLLPIEQLSDGYQVFIEMVAELAYKCIMLNAHHGVNAIKNTYGVVMIDELDMHLHPNWQKRVIEDLMRAFPKIQFVCTTHSPFIVQSCDEKLVSVIDLKNINGHNEIILNKITTGEGSTLIMGVHGNTPIIPNQITTDEVSTLIMGVHSNLSLTNQVKANKAQSYFELLQATISETEKVEKAILIEKLKAEENATSDISLQATMRFERISHGLI